jgi:hypothetical protein
MIKTYCIQCKDKLSGKIGSFYFDISKPFEAESPVFDNLTDMFLWAVQYPEYRNCKMTFND